MRNKIVFEIIGMGSKKYGGFEKYIVCEAKQLAQKGYQLVVVFDRPPICSQYVNELKSHGVEVEVLEQTSRIKFAKKYIRLLKKYKPHIVHTNFSSNIFIVHPISWLMGVDVRVASEHCYPIYNNVFMKIAISFLTLFIDSYIAVSKKSEEALRNTVYFGHSKLKTLYLGVEDFSYNKTEMRKRYTLPLDHILLANIAYHNPVKGVDLLIKALALFYKNNPDANLYLCQIGGGQKDSDTLELKELADNLCVSEKIIWMGIQNKVPEILSACDIYIQPSRSEGIALSVMEASLASLPTIATKVGGLVESAIDGYNAIVTDNEDIDALAQAIEIFYKDKNKRLLFGENARKYATNNFNLNESVYKLISSYYGIN